MHCMNTFRRFQVSLLSKTFGDKHCVRSLWKRKSKSRSTIVDTNKDVIVGAKQTRQTNYPLALQLFSDENKESENMDGRSNQLFDDDLETIKFDIENLKALKLKHQLKQRELSQNKDEEEPSLATMKVLIGTADERHTPSNIPCGGCGAFLHCNHPSIPGFIPQEQFKGKSAKHLATMLCKRCTLMSNSNDVIQMDIDKLTYKQIIRTIKKERALVVMVVDVTDMSNSIIPEFLHNLGRQRPIFIVGNKIDLIPKDRKGYLNGIMDRLEQECYRAQLNPSGKNIRHTCLVSAKTGYGIEQLINRLIKAGNVFGNVYLVGSANSGKSTLFNKFLDSDYCKHTCRDIVQRATVSKWPGTTLNLIKFPIFSANNWRLYLRTMRLKADKIKLQDLQEKNKENLKKYGRSLHGTLIGSVGKTEFRTENTIEKENKRYEQSGHNFTSYTFNADVEALDAVAGADKSIVLSQRRTILEDTYPDARWACDTPGLINQNQLINKLEGEELKKVLTMSMIRPRVFVLRPGDVMFVTGLARIDYLKGKPNTFITAHINHFLPVHVVRDYEADDFYNKNIGTEVLGLPIGDLKRLDKLPSLCAREFNVEMGEKLIASTDLQLSSLGWLSFASGEHDMSALFRAYTPGGRGMHLRSPAMLPNFLAFRGPRISGTKQFGIKKLRL